MSDASIQALFSWISPRVHDASIPAVVLMDGGKERDRVVGALNLNALRSWVQARLASPAAKPQA